MCYILIRSAFNPEYKVWLLRWSLHFLPWLPFPLPHSEPPLPHTVSSRWLPSLLMLAPCSMFNIYLQNCWHSSFQKVEPNSPPDLANHFQWTQRGLKRCSCVLRWLCHRGDGCRLLISLWHHSLGNPAAVSSSDCPSWSTPVLPFLTYRKRRHHLTHHCIPIK